MGEALSEERIDWEGFVDAICEVAAVDRERVGRGSRLLEDLDLDSFALAELVALLLVEFEVGTLESDLGERDWKLVTVGELFDEYRRGVPPARREEFVVHTRYRR
jgi:acyl carrier protein